MRKLEEKKTASFQAAVSLYTRHLAVRCNRRHWKGRFISRYVPTWAGNTPFVRDPRGKSGLLRYISYPLNLRTTRRFLISRLLSPRPPPPQPLPPKPLRHPRRLLAVFVRVLFRVFLFHGRFPERIVERLEESAFRFTAREKQTKLEEIAFASDAPAMSSPSPFPHRFSLPRCFPLLCGEFVFRGEWKKSSVAVETTGTKTRKFLYKYISFGLTLSIYKRLRYISVARRSLASDTRRKRTCL